MAAIALADPASAAVTCNFVRNNVFGVAESFSLTTDDYVQAPTFFTPSTEVGLDHVQFYFAEESCPGSFTAPSPVPTTFDMGFIAFYYLGANTFTMNGFSESSGNIGTRIISGSATPATPAVPEPATWAMMLVGFGGIGFAMRRRKSKITTTVAYA